MREASRAGLEGGVPQRVGTLGPWFHNLHLPDGTQTRPDHPLGDFPRELWSRFSSHVPEDLEGQRVLDVGCNAGFYAFEMARRGAEVLAIDLDRRYLEQARFAAGLYGLEDQVRFEQMQVYDVAGLPESERFDVVLFLGVLYHLRYPLLALDILARRVEELLVLQTLTTPGGHSVETPRDVGFEDLALLNDPGWPRLAFVPDRLEADESNWWVPNDPAVEALLGSAGLEVLAHPAPGVWTARPDARSSPARTWNRSELLAATGRSWQGTSAEKTRWRPGTIEAGPAAPRRR